MFYRVRVRACNRRCGKGLIAGIVLVLLAGAYVLGLVAFNTQRDNGHKEFDIDSGRERHRRERARDRRRSGDRRDDG